MDKTLEFLREVADEAMSKAREGDTSLLNHLAKRSPAFSYYINNVATTKTMTPEQFAQQMPNLLKEAELFRKEYERALKADENEARLNKIEAGLEELKGLLTEAIAEIRKPTETPAKSKGKGKPKAQPESELVTEAEVTEGEEDTNAESEA